MHVVTAGIGLACAWSFLVWWRFQGTKHAFGAFGAVGLALVLYPAAIAILSFVASARLLVTFTVLQAATSPQLWDQAGRILFRNMFWPVVGLLIASRDAAWARGCLARLSPASVVRGDAAVAGLALVPVLAGAQLVGLWILEGPGAVLRTGDETAYFSNATPAHVLALSAAPGVAEEFYFRGALLGVLLLVAPPWAAVVVQALVFGMAHAGFGTISHVLGPLVFALVQGVVAVRLGLLAAMILHAGVNLAFFAFDPGAQGVAVAAMATTLVAAGTMASALRGRSVVFRLTGRSKDGGGPGRS